MKLHDPISATAANQLSPLLAEGEESLIQVSTDLDSGACFGRQWVVVTPARVLVAGGFFQQVEEVRIEELEAAATEALVGGGVLELQRKSGAPITVHYSSSLGVKFSEVARGLEQLRKQERFQVAEKLDRIRCERCGRLLPEKNGICPACIRRLNTLKRIMVHMLPHKGQALLLALASVVTALAQLVPPQITKRLVDNVLVPVEGVSEVMEDRLLMLAVLVLAMVGVRILSWTSELGHGWVMAWLSARVTADIRGRLYRRLEMLSMQFYDKRTVGSLISRVTRDAENLQDFLVDGLPYLVINAMMIIGVLVFLVTMSLKLTLLLLVPVPLILIFSVLFWRRMRVMFHKWGRGWGAMSSRLNEVLHGVRVVKAFNQEKREIEAFEVKNLDLSKILGRTARNWIALWSTMGLVIGVGFVTMWFFGGWEVLDGRLTMGSLLAFYAYIWLVYGPLQWFAEVNTWMTHAFAGAERIFEVIDTPAEAYEDPNAVAIPSMQGKVKFSQVTFGYDKSKPALHDINIDVEPGEMIGLVGKSGVGKTTTINLIARFYDVDRGAIEIDDVDIRKIKLEDLRRQIGIVPQDPVLFSGSIGDNIAYAKPGATLDEIMTAARAARAHQFIMAKPDGYDTAVGERGATLSGGEKQRIAIARAVLHDPKILILDEATSSVDVETEKQIQVAIAELIRGRTTFAIAHRLSTLRNADRLVLLDGGRVQEIGSHDQLMEQRGAFSELVKLQQEVSEVIAVAD